MARFREIPCMYYLNKGECLKGRNTEHLGHCQHCTSYFPRAKKLKKKYKRTSPSKLV